MIYFIQNKSGYGGRTSDTDLLSDILEPILEEKEQEIVARRMKPKGKGGSK